MQEQTNLEWLLEGFKYDLELSVRPKTVEYYYGGTQRFIKWIQNTLHLTEVEQILKKHVQSFFHYLANNHRTNGLKNDPREIERYRWPYYRALKRIDNRILNLPRIRLEVRETLEKYTVQWENEFPLFRTEYRKLYLDATDGKLKLDNNSPESKVTYDSANGKADFAVHFEEDTELTGYFSLKVWVSPNESSDMDLFVTLRKFDRNGNQVLFDNCHVPGKWPLALGWLRLSHRELDEEKSTPWEPYLKSVIGFGEKVKAGEIVPCEIPILPTSILFRKGESLKLDISGIYRGGEDIKVPFGYNDTANRGMHSIYTGGKYDSHLLVPLVPLR